MPHLFRKAKSPQEWIGPSTERVPLDADLHHMYMRKKEIHFKKDIKKVYGIDKRPAGHERKLWSVTTGEWIWEDRIVPAHIFPPLLGDKVAIEVFGTLQIWRASNGMMVPRPIKRALDDWALTIVPDVAAVPTVEMTPAGGRFQRDYKFKVLDPENPGLRVEMYSKNPMPVQNGEGLTGNDLDGRKLGFYTAARPLLSHLYFHCCCAIWKQTCVRNPGITERDEFGQVFLEAMTDLWGEHMVYRMHRSITDIFKPREQGGDHRIQNIIGTEEG